MAEAREQLLSRLRQFPDRLARLVEGRSVESLRRAGAGGAWGVVEHLCHLRDYDEVSLERVERMLVEDNPELELFDTDLMAIERDYHSQNPFDALAAFRRLRQRLVARLAQLTPEQWQRTARHPHLGEVNLDWLARYIDEHDQEHYQAIKDLL